MPSLILRPDSGRIASTVRTIGTGRIPTIWADWAPKLALLLASAIAFPIGSFIPTGNQGQYIVLAPLWYDFEQTAGLVNTAGGRIVGLGASSVLFIVHSEQPEFVRALYSAGAWLVIDAGAPGGCLSSERAHASEPRGT